jgi:hypothetical protein
MKKLTEKQNCERVIGRIFKRIESIERDYGSRNTQIACQRYAVRQMKERRIRYDIEEKKKELEELEKKRSKRR